MKLWIPIALGALTFACGSNDRTAPPVEPTPARSGGEVPGAGTGGSDPTEGEASDPAEGPKEQVGEEPTEEPAEGSVPRQER